MIEYLRPQDVSSLHTLDEHTQCACQRQETSLFIVYRWTSQPASQPALTSLFSVWSLERVQGEWMGLSFPPATTVAAIQLFSLLVLSSVHLAVCDDTTDNQLWPHLEWEILHYVVEGKSVVFVYRVQYAALCSIVVVGLLFYYMYQLEDYRTCTSFTGSAFWCQV